MSVPINHDLRARDASPSYRSASPRTSDGLSPAAGRAGSIAENVARPRSASVRVTVVGDGRFEIRERLADHHHLLVARVRFRPADLVHPFRAHRRVPGPTRHSLQVAESEHILLAPRFLQYINHSCDPNVIFDTEGRRVEAVRAIEPGEEIVFFYPSTEWCMASPFDCLCGAAHCVGRIAGASTLGPDILPTYHFAPHVKRLLSDFPYAGIGSMA